MNYLIFLLFILINFSAYAQGSYDRIEHNNAMDSIDWGSAFNGFLILVFIVWIINLVYEGGLRKVDTKKEYKQPKKAYKVIGLLHPTAEEMKVPCKPQEILEWGESKGFLEYTKAKIYTTKRGVEAARKFRLDRRRIKLYFKCKEFHNSFKKGTVVEFEWPDTVNGKLEMVNKVGEVISITEFTGNPYSDNALVKFQDGSKLEVGTIGLKKRVYF